MIRVHEEKAILKIGDVVRRKEQYYNNWWKQNGFGAGYCIVQEISFDTASKKEVCVIKSMLKYRRVFSETLELVKN